MIKNITMKNCASYDSTGVNIEYCESQEMLQVKKDEEKTLSTEYEKMYGNKFFKRTICISKKRLPDAEVKRQFGRHFDGGNS